LGVRFRYSTDDAANDPDSEQAGDGEIEDYLISVAAAGEGTLIDWGDLPDGTVASDNNYVTTGPDGPRHTIVANNPVLGVQVDAEADGQPTTGADGDNNAAYDDEDGVTFPTPQELIQGATVNLSYTALDPGATGALVYAWVDWNGDGDFGGLNEQILSGQAPTYVDGITDNVVPVTVPVDAATGEQLGVRFRYSTDDAANDPDSEQAGDGEIEDYLISVAAAGEGTLIDWGDLPDGDDGNATPGSQSYPTNANDNGEGVGASHIILAENNPVLGVQVDAEGDGAPDATATGDDTAAYDDEDGVSIPALERGQTVDIEYSVNDLVGDARLNAFIDWNGDGDFGDPFEQVANDVDPANKDGSANTLSVTVPVDAVTGTGLGVRFRLSNDTELSATGAAGSGEVEDYLVQVAAAQGQLVDWGDLPDGDDNNGTPGSQSYPTNANDVGEGVGASHIILAENNPVLGDGVDAEIDGVPSGATGDDLAGLDDEDGVTIPPLTQGATVDLSYRVNDPVGDALLNAFIDWNGDGDFDDLNEQVASDLDPVNDDGTPNTLSVTVPVDAVTGADLGVRFRLSNDSGLGASEQANSGEVEDYLVQIAAAEAGSLVDWGDLPNAGAGGDNVYPTTVADNGPSHVIVVDNPVLGVQVDAEADGQPTAGADGDDTTTYADEDGVTFPDTLTQGETVTLTYTVLDPGASGALVYAWIDWNGDGDFADRREQIANGVTPTDVVGGENTLSVTVRRNAATGEDLGVRFRYSTDPAANNPAGGQAADGEIEDYLVQVTAKPAPPPPAAIPIISGPGLALLSILLMIVGARGTRRGLPGRDRAK
jgi:hypothetical protein